MKAFQETQLAFIDHLKNPDVNKFDQGIEDRRLNVYRELFFNNIVGFLSTGFPVLESLYTEQEWQGLARQFFAEHECRSPFFVDISKEFVEYLSNTYQLKENDPPFLQELAHYEWLELAMSVKKQTQDLTYWDGDADVSSISMSELATLVSYQFPVHQIRPDFQPQEPGEPVYIVVYRNTDDNVNFTLVNAVSAHLLSLVQQHPGMQVSDLIQHLCAAMPQLPSEQVEQGTLDSVRLLLQQQILVPH